MSQIQPTSKIVALRHDGLIATMSFIFTPELTHMENTLEKLTQELKDKFQAISARGKNHEKEMMFRRISREDREDADKVAISLIEVR